MTKKILGGLLLTLLVCAAALAAWVVCGRTLTLSIPREEIEAEAQKVFPVHHSVVKFDLVESRLECLPAENRLAISGVMNIEVLGMINATGTCRVSGQPAYNADLQAIQLRDVRIEALTVDGVPKKLQTQVQDLGGKALENFLGEFSFYKFDQRKRWQKFLGEHVRGVTVGEDGLSLTVGR